VRLKSARPIARTSRVCSAARVSTSPCESERAWAGLSAAHCFSERNTVPATFAVTKNGAPITEVSWHSR
jgi:hypothetical protein